MAGLDDWRELCLQFECKLSETVDKNVRKMAILEHIKRSEAMNLKIPDFSLDLEWINTDRKLSFQNDLKGGVIVLDFFTYCCINCIHILPDLEALEHEYPIEKGVAVIGVHSAKFANEKVSANIVSAVLRYNISHPVVNDSEASLWNKLGIQCWPTLTIVSPSGNLLYSFVGEGHREKLLEFIQVTVDFYSSQGQITLDRLPLALVKNNLPPSPLSFPGKVCVSEDGRSVVVSDSGHHRILVLSAEGVVKHCIGGKESGFKDGDFQMSQFCSPQGVCFHGSQDIYVADTENHAVRKINLLEKSVTTVAGTGKLGLDKVGGEPGNQQEITSPWDICLGRSIGSSENDVLFIAMAGSHQIWGLFLKDGKWTKKRDYRRGVCVRLAGNGNEENRNNSYPDKAGFAQPSGLAVIQNGESPMMFVADAESSTLRTMSLKDGAVKALVGGERDPTNLFAYGDIDGTGLDARLQHPLGVAILTDQPPTILIADSYNHKIKKVEVSNKSCISFIGSGKSGDRIGSELSEVLLNEPGGLCVDRQNNLLYVADTNNHSIKLVNLTTNITSQLPVIFPSEDTIDVDGVFKRLTSKFTSPVHFPDMVISPGGQVNLIVQVNWPNGIHLTEGVTSRWQVWTEDDSVPNVIKDGEFRDGVKTLPDIVINIPQSNGQKLSVCFEAVIYYCDEVGVCKMKKDFYRFNVHIKLNNQTNHKQKIDINLD